MNSWHQSLGGRGIINRNMATVGFFRSRLNPFSFPFPLPGLSASPCTAIPLNLVKVLENLRLTANINIFQLIHLWWWLCPAFLTTIVAHWRWAHPKRRGLLSPANVTAILPAQGETGVSQVLPAKEEENKASLWRGKSLGWMDIPYTRCEHCCYTEQGNTLNLALYTATGEDPLFHVAVRVQVPVFEQERIPCFLDCCLACDVP